MRNSFFMKSITGFLCFIFLVSFLPAQEISDPTGIKGRSFENILYKVSGDGDSLLLDVYLPEKKENNEKFPVLMIIHGGAWVEGDKTLETIYYMKKLRQEALKNNYAVVSINYRLLGKDVHFPAPVLDCKDAVRWIRANAPNYGFDPENIGLWGGSAGGHLAMLAGYTDDSMWKDDAALTAYSSEVDYIIDNFGPGDLNKLLKTNAGFLTIFFFKTFLSGLYDIRNKLILAMTGTSLEEDEKRVKETLEIYSPLHYMSSGPIPTMILHGTRDKVVPLKESKTVHNELNSLNVLNEFIKVRKGNHGFNNISREETDQLVSRTILFMKSQLN